MQSNSSNKEHVLSYHGLLIYDDLLDLGNSWHPQLCHKNSWIFKSFQTGHILEAASK